MRCIRLHGLFACLIAVLCAARAADAKNSGAIFTTDANGTVVNGNLYTNPCDVYLNGGPGGNAPCNAAGLSDGEYYFQVTDPAGTVLLSTDDIEQRRVLVQSGVMVAYFGASSSCTHQIGLGKCYVSNPDNISVQLMPFSATPNPGGVYKVWMTPVNKYFPNHPSATFGFKHQYSKTDNFKVVDCPDQNPPGGDDGDDDSSDDSSSDDGSSDEDDDSSSDDDSSESGIAGGNGDDESSDDDDSSGDGCSDDDDSSDDNSSDDDDSSDEDPEDPPIECDYLCTIVINSYFDANGTGSQDADDDLPLNGIRFDVCYIAPGQNEICTVLTAGSSAFGQTTIEVPAGSTVLICEQLPQAGEPECSWLQTEPNEGSVHAQLVNDQWCYSFVCPANISSVQTLAVGNISVCEATKAKSTGYWKGSSGKAKLSKNDPSWRKNLNKLPLRTISGSIYKVPTSGDFASGYANFRTWMAASSYTNMANQLSQQLAAVRLSVMFSGFNANHRVLIPADAAAVIGAPENTMKVSEILALATDSLSQYGKTTNSHPQRPYQEALKLILKAISLNQLPIVNQEPAEIVYPAN